MADNIVAKKMSTIALAGGRAFFVSGKTDASVQFVPAGFTNRS